MIALTIKSRRPSAANSLAAISNSKNTKDMSFFFFSLNLVVRSTVG